MLPISSDSIYQCCRRRTLSSDAFTAHLTVVQKEFPLRFPKKKVAFSPSFCILAPFPFYLEDGEEAVVDLEPGQVLQESPRRLFREGTLGALRRFNGFFVVVVFHRLFVVVQIRVILLGREKSKLVP